MKTYQTASQVVSIKVVLQEAGDAEEWQAELLEAVLYGLWGPHTGAQLGTTSTERPHHQ